MYKNHEDFLSSKTHTRKSMLYLKVDIRSPKYKKRAMWKQWVTALLGLLTIAVPFMGLTGDSLTWSLAIVGIAVAVLSLWGGVEEQQLEQELRERRV